MEAVAESNPSCSHQKEKNQGLCFRCQLTRSFNLNDVLFRDKNPPADKKFDPISIVTEQLSSLAETPVTPKAESIFNRKETAETPVTPKAESDLPRIYRRESTASTLSSSNIEENNRFSADDLSSERSREPSGSPQQSKDHRENGLEAPSGLEENSQASSSSLCSSKPPLPSLHHLLAANSKQSWLLRLFESKLFTMHIAVQYLFNSKEPGVLSYLGRKMFLSFVFR